MAVILWIGVIGYGLPWSARQLRYQSDKLLDIISHKIQITTSKIIIWVMLLLSSLEFYFITGTRSQRNVAHWMKPWIFCFQWCISCVFACCLISQNSPFCFRNKYLKYILHWRRWVLLQKNESFFSWHCTRPL